MAGINTTPEDRQRMAMKGYSFDEDDPYIPGAEGPVKTTYHNPRTGKEMVLPADGRNLVYYLSKGLQIGPASPELKEKWKNRVISDNETISGAVLPPELQDDSSKLRTEISELKQMILDLAKTGTIAPINDTIEVEEEMSIPYNTQLGMFE